MENGGCYDSIVKINANRDSSGINASDRETFYINAYNQWIDSIMSLNPQQLQQLEKIGMDATKVQQYLSTFGKVSSMDDITRLKSNPLFDKDLNSWELNDGWDHIKSRYINGRQEDAIGVKHRLYVGCQNQDIWKMMQLFKTKCEEKGIPYYFKSAASSERADKIVIYSDTKELAQYIDILREIGKENPEIVQRCGTPPVLTGRIDDWIGIGDEPPKKENGENQSFNSIRADIIDNSVEEVLLDSIKQNKGKMVEYNGESVSFNDLFINNATEYLLEKLGKSKKLDEDFSLSGKDLSSDKFRAYLEKHLRSSISKGISKLDEVKDKKTELLATNYRAIFSIPTRDGKAIEVSTIDMDHIIKRFVPVMQQVDGQFNNKVKANIETRAQQVGIDTKTFCFQETTRQAFEQIDKTTPVVEEVKTQETPTENVNETQSPQEPVAKQNKEKSKINSIEISRLINPTLMDRRITLPNGAQISANQYVQEFIAPHIPRDGKFVMNSGSEITAKQFIEEFVLSNPDPSKMGDIKSILAENTRANNGTIAFKDEVIKSIDIAGKINPTLMDRRITLPNGAQISANQYVQEFVAPHIPKDGKFLLKNGAEITARQFIEEVVLFQIEDYGGNIETLLEENTKANNGVIEISSRTKEKLDRSDDVLSSAIEATEEVTRTSTINDQSQNIKALHRDKTISSEKQYTGEAK